MKYLILAALLAVAGMSGAQARAYPNSDTGREVKTHMMRIANRLEFSEEQRAEARDLLQHNFANLKQIRKEMQANRKVMKTLVVDSGYDVNAVAELSRTQGELYARKLENRVSTRAAFNKLLTDEQNARLVEFKGQRSDRREFLREQRMERRRYFRDQDGP